MVSALATAVSPRAGVPAAARLLAAAVGSAGGADAAFALKSLASVALAYGIALRIGLDRPSWAVITCLIVAQPLAGAVLSKALFRLCGTFVGAGVAVLLVPTLVDAPEWLCAALVGWVGLCTYLGALDRTPRSYLFLLAGYSAAIVGFPAVSTPGAIFEIAAVRVQEIGIGILVSMAVHALILPRSVAAQLAVQVGAMIADAERLTIAVLRRDAGEIGLDRSALVRDVAALDALAVHLPYDLSRLPLRRTMLRALQHQLVEVLVNASAVDDRLDRLAAAPAAALSRLTADVATWLETGAGPDGPALIARARALEPPPIEVRSMADALRLSLLDRLARLIAAHRLVRRLGDAIESRGVGPARDLDPVLREAERPSRHKDRAGALLGALATALAMLAGCVWWIATAWPDGANAVVYAGMMGALFSHLDNPGRTAWTVVAGVVVGIATAFVYRFAVLPRITDFGLLICALAPAFLLLSTASQQRGWGGFAIGGILAFPGLVGLESHYDPDFAGFANTACGEFAGALLAAVSLGLIRTVGLRSRAARIVAAARGALDHKLRNPTLRESGWTAAMLDRIGLLSTGQDDMRQRMSDVLRLLRLGRAVDSLATVAERDPAQRPIAALLVRRLRRAIADPGTIADAQRLFAGGLRRFARSGSLPVRRDAIIAIVALACNLPERSDAG